MHDPRPRGQEVKQKVKGSKRKYPVLTPANKQFILPVCIGVRLMSRWPLSFHLHVHREAVEAFQALENPVSLERLHRRRRQFNLGANIQFEQSITEDLLSLAVVRQVKLPSVNRGLVDCRRHK